MSCSGSYLCVHAYGNHDDVLEFKVDWMAFCAGNSL